jgi:hypothetical protein
LLPSLRLLIYSLPAIINCFRALIFKHDEAWCGKDRTAQAAADLVVQLKGSLRSGSGIGKFRGQIAESYTVPAAVLLLLRIFCEYAISFLRNLIISGFIIEVY